MHQSPATIAVLLISDSGNMSPATLVVSTIIYQKIAQGKYVCVLIWLIPLFFSYKAHSVIRRTTQLSNLITLSSQTENQVKILGYKTHQKIESNQKDIKVWKNSEKLCGNTRLRLVFPQHFLFSQTFTCVAITQQKHRKCFSKLISQFIIQRNAKNFNSLSIWNGMSLISSRYYLFLKGLLLDFFHETDQNVWVMDFWCHRVQK